MQKFTVHKGVATALLRNNIDTDAIIPSYEMKKVSKLGLSDGLFAASRYMHANSRVENPEFILNKPEHKDTSVLLCGENFGCGSSREHAVWALYEYGIRCIIAPSVGSIFFKNCVRNGILPIQLNTDKILEINTWVEMRPQTNLVEINLQEQTINLENYKTYPFEISGADKDMLLNGLDSIALTLRLEDKIQAYEEIDKNQRPWAYL